ncbi:MBL fold metallo-hydrolase [Candidatus Bathyarchaeota archaeon A05DMB-2]|nr:MBL fold metallo-hydrolase [Candidatus Bathyarchaeota archaeon A05DMB-2]
MHTKQVGEHIFLIDLETGGFKNLIASYVLKGTKIIIVETGPTSSIPNLLLGLKELNVALDEVAYVAISHVHIDHGGGVGTLLKSLPNAKVIVHPRGTAHLVDPTKLWLQSKQVLGQVADIYGAPEPVPENRIIAAEDGFAINAGNNLHLEAIETLGHASHNLSYHESLNEAIFPGDAAGMYISEFDVVVPTTPPPFHLDVALQSLDKLASFKPQVLYYSHFGKASDGVKRLQDYALQIKRWGEIAEEGVRKGQNAYIITERILREDEVMRKAASFFKPHPVLMKTAIENSVQGFIDYAEKSQA